MKQIYRSTRDKILGGVAAGMADYLDLDVVLVRLLWVLFIFMGGIGLPVYIVAWIIIPPEPYPGAGRDSGTRRNYVAPVNPQHMTDSDTSTSEDSAGEGIKNGEKTGIYEDTSKDRTTQALGILLVVFGVVFLFRETLHLDIFRYVWPVLLILLGVYILVNDKRGA